MKELQGIPKDGSRNTKDEGVFLAMDWGCAGGARGSIVGTISFRIGMWRQPFEQHSRSTNNRNRNLEERY